MASIPVVDIVDKRIGIISSIGLMFLTFIVLYLMTYEIPNPLPVFQKVQAKTEITQIELKKYVVESGGGGGGTPTNAPKGPDVPQTEKVITSTRPSNTQVNNGQSNHTNGNNNTNTASTNKPSNDPFYSGGDGDGSGGGSGGGFGPDSGTGSGSGDGGIGYGTRTRQSNVDVQNITIETDAKIAYKLTVDSDGNVVAFTYYGSKTTTTDLTLINKIGVEIKKQVKYSKKKNAPLVYVDYTVNVRAT
jgi:hypothetical protein